MPPGSTSSSDPPPARRPRIARSPPVEPATGFELLLAALVALALAAIAIGGALFDGSRVFAPGAREHLSAPWSAVAARAPNDSSATARPAISAPRSTYDPRESVGVDLAARQYTIEELAEGRWPTWNPLLATGQPWLANPRNGVLDPQVLAQAALQRIGGGDLARRGYAWFAWLRLAAAGLGAYVLARRLGTSTAAAALAGIGFAGSGLMIAHVAAPIGHVVAVVPWVFVALDRVREHPRVRSVALVASATALLVTGGSPETSFLAGVAALAFAASVTEGRARWLAVGGLVLGTLCAAPVLLPFLSVVSESAAFVARRVALDARAGFDVLSLGLALVTIAIVVAWRGLVHDNEVSARADSDARAVARLAATLPELKVASLESASPARAAGPTSNRARSASSAARSGGWQEMAGLIGVVMALVTCAFVLGERGAGDRGRAWLLVDSVVAPVSTSAPGSTHADPSSATASLAAATLTSFAQHGGAWIAGVVVALGLVSFLSAAGPLRARRTLQVTGIVSLLLALGVGGVVDLWRLLPLFGLGDTSVAAALSALCFALLAAEALDSSPRTARRAAALVYVAWVGLALFARPPEPPRFAPDPDEPYFACSERPPASWTRHAGFVAGFVATTLPADALYLTVDEIDEDGRELTHAVLSQSISLEPADASGRRAFRSMPIDAAELSPGTWRFVLALQRHARDGTIETIGARTVGYSSVARDPRIGPVSMFGTMAAFLLVLFVAGTRSRGAWIASAVVALQVLAWTREVWSTVPASTGFGVSATERFLARSPDHGRVWASPDVLPGDTTLFARLANAQGGDDFASASAASFRARLAGAGRGQESGTEAVRRDRARLRDPRTEATPLDPTRVDGRSNAFRLLGVTHVVTMRAVELPDFDPVAGPAAPATSGASGAESDRDPATITEAHVYAARDPLPRAFCVGSVVERHRAMSGPAAFDPRTEAFLDEGRAWSPNLALSRSTVTLDATSSDRQRLSADVDGDALLVVTEAFASGWTATVDGRSADILRVDDAFRGVVLAPGKHVVEFEYAPASLRVGAWIGVLAVAALWILMAVPRRYA